MLLSLSLFSCDSNDDDSLPEVEIADKEKWLDRVNGDIISLRNAVLVVQEEDSITNIQIVDNSYVLEFVKNEPVKFILDNVNNPAPLIGIHKIDKNISGRRLLIQELPQRLFLKIRTGLTMK